MKRFFSIAIALLFVLGCLPTLAFETQDYDPIGDSIAGFQAYELAAGGQNGDLVTSDILSDYSVIFVNVWDSACGPCLGEMPYFQQLHENYESQGVLVMGVVSTMIGGTYAGAWNVVQNNAYTYLNVIQDSVIYSVYSQNGFLPQTFIVNSEGIVVDFIRGGTNYNTLESKARHWLSIFNEGTEFEVTFVDSITEEVIDTQIVGYGQGAVAPEAPEHEGYTFTGWSCDFNFITSNLTVYANYTRRTYKVDFYDSITGDRLSRQYVRYGDPAVAPEPPVHEGYTFVGWDQDFSCVTSAMEIYTIYDQEGDTPVADGDMDGDGILTAADGLNALRVALGILNPTGAQLAAGDLDGDGIITTAEALQILRMAIND